MYECELYKLSKEADYRLRKKRMNLVVYQRIHLSIQILLGFQDRVAVAEG